jgi:restriction system protein
MWMVRAGRGGESVDDFIKHGLVALGGARLGKLDPAIKKDELLKLYAEKYPEEKDGSRAVWASQLMRLVTEIKPNDEVVTFDRDQRLYFFGTMTGDYEWTSALIEDKPHIRRVRWTHQVPRDLLKVETRNTLGGIATLFKLGPGVAQDLHAHALPIGSTTADVLEAPKEKSDDEAAGEAILREDAVEKADEFIEDAINRLDWEQMQELIAGILRGMGYRTSVSPRGSDRGVDIFASPDGLGLQEPRIFVEVKHRPHTQMDAEKIRAFLGGRKHGDRCLYVSTGSFSKEARYEAERATVPTTLVDLQGVRRLLVEHYEKLDAVTRALVPLKRIYWPVRVT